MSHIVRAPQPPPDPFDTTRAQSIRNHGLLASIAFLVLMPLGTLIARYFRTFTTKLVNPVPVGMSTDSQPGGGSLTVSSTPSSLARWSSPRG